MEANTGSYSAGSSGVSAPAAPFSQWPVYFRHAEAFPILPGTRSSIFWRFREIKTSFITFSDVMPVRRPMKWALFSDLSSKTAKAERLADFGGVGGLRLRSASRRILRLRLGMTRVGSDDLPAGLPARTLPVQSKRRSRRWMTPSDHRG